MIGDIQAGKLHVTVDPEDLLGHQKCKRPALRMATPAVGLDLNPGWIGIAAVEKCLRPR